MMEYFTILGHYQGWLYLLLLSVLEIILGIDNIIFISITTDQLRLPHLKNRARITGLSFALVIRFIMLGLLSFLVHLRNPVHAPWFGVFNYEDLVLLAGGVFLIYKSTMEMHKSISNETKKEKISKISYPNIIFQIVVIDFVFSFDSVISAVGMTNGIEDQLKANPIVIVYLAVLLSMIVMIKYSGIISTFIQNNPTIKTIALSFLLMIGIFLVAESFGHKIPKGYIYFGFGFSLLVEMLNIRMRKNSAKKNA